jgi:mannose-6-phosphate isomerase-like protein (cupin superfamily)
MDSPNKRNEHKWGWSQHLFNNGLVDVAIAVGRKGGCSSWHLHEHKSNTFIVREGFVRIGIKWPDRQVYFGTIGPGMSYCVAAGVIHIMEFVTDATLYETYVADPGQTIDLADIVRLDEGTEPEPLECASQQS